MRQLMISLDKKILDPTSAVAKRMIEYGKKDELFIIIPHSKRAELDLSSTVHVTTSGGRSKIGQFGVLYGVAEKIIKGKKIQEITTQDPFFTGLLGVWLKNQFNLPLEVQLHGDFFSNNYYSFKSGPMNYLRWHIGTYVVRRATLVRVVSERIKCSLIERLHINSAQIEVRPISIDIEFIKNYLPKCNLHQRYSEYEKFFLCLGRLDPVKNIRWLIDTFTEVVKQHPRYLLLVVGQGQEYGKLQSKISSLKLENNVKLEAWTNDPYSYLKTADCLLFPSLSEGYGLVPMEAHYVGTPLIMNDVGVANYELKPSEKVKILPINDKEKWTEAILSI